LSHDEASFSSLTSRVTFNKINLRLSPKKLIMETCNTQQEVLFLIDSSFVRQELYKDSFSENDKQPANTGADKFEQACWNGMLRDWLPGIDQNPHDKKLFVWKVLVANAFVCAELSGAPTEIKARQSLNPYLFLSSINNN
jgi:hypothetical protein